MPGLFANEKLNTGRQDELDIVKGLAIIFMVWCHTLRTLGGDTSTVAGLFVDSILGGPFAAPVFMVCMGIGICFSRSSTPALMAKRGLSLLLMGYGLNICRYIVPQVIISLITKETISFASLTASFFEVDILHFAGLAFLLLATFKKLNAKAGVPVAVGALMLVAGTFLKDRGTGVLIVDYILGLFWKTCDNTYFTLFHWFIFPAAGCALGELLQRCTDKRLAYKCSLQILFPIGAAFELTAIVLGIGLTSIATEYFYLSVIDAAFLIPFVISWIGVCYFLHERFSKVGIGYLQKLSRHINNIFCIHWVLIGLEGIIRALTWKNQTLGFVPALLIAAANLILSAWLAERYAGWKARRRAAAP